MMLSVLERLKLLEVLPQAGDISTIKIVREVREALTFTEGEHTEFGIETQDPGQCGDKECGYVGFAAPDDSCPKCHGGKFIRNGQQSILWNKEAARDAEIKIGAKAKSIIVKELNRLSDKNGVTDQHISLYEKFLPDGE